jgi:tripartite-type tricarboxylate transporter receptor subunit TctC
MTRPLPRRLALIALTALAQAPLAWGQAAGWPAKPVTIVVPFPAGGGTDAFARPLTAVLSKQTGKQFIIHNKGGAGPALQDLVAGQIDLMFDGLGSSAQHIRSGRVKALAVAADKRAPGFPDVPTTVESGVPSYQVATWYGLWAPKGTPKEIVAAMQAELKKAFASDEIKSALTGLGSTVPSLWGDEFGRFVAAETKRWAEVVKSSGAKLD